MFCNYVYVVKTTNKRECGLTQFRYGCEGMKVIKKYLHQMITYNVQRRFRHCSLSARSCPISNASPYGTDFCENSALLITFI